MNVFIDAIVRKNPNDAFDRVSLKNDRPMSFLISLILHVVIFMAAGASFVKPPQYDTDRGYGSVEVNLLASPSQLIDQSTVVKAPVEAKSDFAVQQTVAPVIKKEELASKAKGRDAVTAQSAGGAVSTVVPNYLKNPSPVYPESARRRGEEGVVLLTVAVNKEGFPTQVGIKKSSGFQSLDQSAIKAVKKWQFRSALIGAIAVEANVEVPVRFQLTK